MSRYDRWDRDEFGRVKYQNGNYFRDHEPDSDVIFDERIERHDRHRNRPRVVERARVGAGDSLTTFITEPPLEAANQALAPYRRPRPQFMRRQSSLDTHDRRTMIRPYDADHSPAPRRVVEEVEEVQEIDDRYHRRRNFSPDSYGSSRGRNRPIGRKGRTKFPKTGVHKQVILDLGVPFEEEEDYIMVLRALDPAVIDEIVESSKRMRNHNREEAVRVTKTIQEDDGVRGTVTTRIEKMSRPGSPVDELYDDMSDTYSSNESELVREHMIAEDVADRQLVLVAPRRRRHSDAMIRREIEAAERALMEKEAEWRLLEANRSGSNMHLRNSSDSIEVKEQVIDEPEVVRIRKDKKVRVRVRSKSRKTKPNPKVTAMALMTLL